MAAMTMTGIDGTANTPTASMADPNTKMLKVTGASAQDDTTIVAAAAGKRVILLGFTADSDGAESVAIWSGPSASGVLLHTVRFLAGDSFVMDFGKFPLETMTGKAMVLKKAGASSTVNFVLHFEVVGNDIIG